MNSFIKIIILVILVLAILYTLPQPSNHEEEPFLETDVQVATPKPGDLVSSPLVVEGKARGTWFFEANLPVTLKDSNGKILAQKGFMAQGEWMTEDHVSFEGTLEFAQPETEYGVLLIEKDNPSELSEFDASFAVPVRFR
ncbi:MAG: Gmad2 immunoglobulin-like domain-containing protein [Candidatus Doudnabacteria bacterium]|nr:Gmad2 immunoglobulin-like domain-containing protein [Candidatus Doudnabacteria bacterium]